MKSATKITASVGHVVLIRDVAKDKSDGGIALPAQAQELPVTGTVVDHFPGTGSKGRLRSVEWEAGDRLIFNPHAAEKYTHTDGVEYLILNEADVMAEIEQVTE